MSRETVQLMIVSHGVVQLALKIAAKLGAGLMDQAATTGRLTLPSIRSSKFFPISNSNR
jgi:hypothetical protein